MLLVLFFAEVFAVISLLFCLNFTFFPVADRITFKLLIKPYKVIYFSEPSYLLSQLKFKSNNRNLRGHDYLLLEISRSNSDRMGDHSFAVCAPTLCNCLPFEIRNSTPVELFKISFKIFLFSIRYHSLPNH